MVCLARRASLLVAFPPLGRTRYQGRRVDANIWSSVPNTSIKRPTHPTIPVRSSRFFTWTSMLAKVQDVLPPMAMRKGVPNTNRSTTPTRFRSRPKFNTLLMSPSPPSRVADSTPETPKALAYVDKILRGAQTSRSARRAAYEIRVDRQSQDRQGARTHDCPFGAGTDGSGYRIARKR
jgi:hypothetical protein